jgi:hypothetical protein
MRPSLAACALVALAALDVVAKNWQQEIGVQQRLGKMRISVCLHQRVGVCAGHELRSFTRINPMQSLLDIGCQAFATHIPI